MLELLNKFSKVAEYRINMQKSTMFINTNNKISEKEIKMLFLFMENFLLKCFLCILRR